MLMTSSVLQIPGLPSQVAFLLQPGQALKSLVIGIISISIIIGIIIIIINYWINENREAEQLIGPRPYS